ncbi:hypothetical protein FACS189413_18030 [Bacteroidia bacterium]|nr:hypothetical protein FACS189413_18030 [Bacteroidia bacterium]
MEKDNIEKYIKNIFSTIALVMTIYIGGEITKFLYDSRPAPIAFFSEPTLWVGTLFLAIVSFIMSILTRTSESRLNEELEENSDEKQQQIRSHEKKKRFIKDISVFVQYIGVIVLHQTAKYYRPSKLQTTTDEYIFWLSLFWLALFWFVIYIIVVGVIFEVKRQNKQEGDV